MIFRVHDLVCLCVAPVRCIECDPSHSQFGAACVDTDYDSEMITQFEIEGLIRNDCLYCMVQETPTGWCILQDKLVNKMFTQQGANDNVDSNLA